MDEMGRNTTGGLVGEVNEVNESGGASGVNRSGQEEGGVGRVQIHLHTRHEDIELEIPEETRVLLVPTCMLRPLLGSCWRSPVYYYGRVAHAFDSREGV